MRNKKKIKLSLLFIIISFFSFCQKQNEIVVVESFLRDVYSTNKTLNQISEEYRFKCDKEKEDEKFIKLIKYLKEEKKQFYSQIKKVKVEPLNISKISGLWAFENKEDESVYVVSINGKVYTYALLKESKIVSFVYYRKGRDNPAFFIPYWLIPLK